MAERVQNQGGVAVISAPGFAYGWIPLGVARITGYLKSQGLPARNLSLGVAFSHWLERKHPTLVGIDKDIGEFSHSWHELYFSGRLFGHRDPKELIRETVIDQERNLDVFHTQLGFETKPRPMPNPALLSRRVSRLMKFGRVMESFLLNEIARMDLDHLKIAAFSCVDTQFLTSLFMVREMKRRAPRLTVVFGGPMFLPDNAAAYQLSFPEIDHIVIGEGEETLTRLYRNRDRTNDAKLHIDLAAPHGSERIGSGKQALKAYPPPDFDDLPKSTIKRYSLTINMAKGCSHWRCSFCGINERGQQVRKAKDVFAEIRFLVKRHRTKDINFGDWEINGSPEELEALCDLLIANRLRITAWGEVNTRNITPRLLAKMKKAGIASVQIGIESFSSATLRKIGKPAALTDNVKILKWGIETGMTRVFFNVLTNHPGAGEEDALENLKVLKRIAHLLRPPVHFVLNEMELYRSSALCADPKKYGIEKLEDFRYFERCYPASIRKGGLKMFYLSYPRHRVAPAWRRISRFLDQVKEKPVRCAMRLRNGKADIQDNRSGIEKRYSLNGTGARILELADQSVVKLGDLPERTGLTTDELEKTIRRLDKLGLVLIDRGRLLSLPINKDAAAHAREKGEALRQPARL